MASTVKEILAAIAPQFPDDSVMDVFIELAEGRTNECFYGEKYNQAVAYLVAHMMTLSDSTGPRAGGVSGAINSKKEGDLAVGFASPSSDSGVNPDLSQTSYGTQLAALRKGCQPFAATTGFDYGC